VPSDTLTTVGAYAALVTPILAVGAVLVTIIRFPQSERIERVRLSDRLDRLETDVKRLGEGESRRDGVLQGMQQQISSIMSILSRLDERTKTHSKEDE